MGADDAPRLRNNWVGSRPGRTTAPPSDVTPIWRGPNVPNSSEPFPQNVPELLARYIRPGHVREVGVFMVRRHSPTTFGRHHEVGQSAAPEIEVRSH